jgi:hypothetical protein
MSRVGHTWRGAPSPHTAHTNHLRRALRRKPDSTGDNADRATDKWKLIHISTLELLEAYHTPDPSCTGGDLFGLAEDGHTAV